MHPHQPSDRSRSHAESELESGVSQPSAGALPAAEHVRSRSGLSLVHPSGNLFSVEGAPLPALVQFCERLGISFDGSRKGLLESLRPLLTAPVAAVSASIAARCGSSDALIFKTELESLGFMDAVHAPPRAYQDALLFGGPLDWVRERLAELHRQWERGVRFDRLIMLGSDRPRDEERWDESMDRIGDPANSILPLKSGWSYSGPIPADEYEIMRTVFDQAALPAEWGAELPVVWLRTTRDIAEGRADTAATLRHYVQQLPGDRGAILAASSQPYVQYQLLTAAAVFRRENVAFELVQGIGASARKYRGPMTGYLNLLARRILLEQELDHSAVTEIE